MSTRTNLTVVSTVLVFLGVGVALDPFFRQAAAQALEVGSHEEDLEKLQGTWNLVRLVAGGEVQDVPPSEGVMVIKGTHLQWPTPEDSWTITLDPKRNPKWFDFRGNIPFPNSRGLPSNTDIVYRGIYRLEGDILTFCVSRGGPEKQFEKYRPTKFESTPNSGLYLHIYKRKRP